MNALVLVKFIGCWLCIIAVIVLLILGHQPFGLVGVLAILAVAFAQAPTNWA